MEVGLRYGLQSYGLHAALCASPVPPDERRGFGYLGQAATSIDAWPWLSGAQVCVPPPAPLPPTPSGSRLNLFIEPILIALVCAWLPVHAACAWWACAAASRTQPESDRREVGAYRIWCGGCVSDSHTIRPSCLVWSTSYSASFASREQAA